MYAATKAGVMQLCRSLAFLGEEGIRVNALCPGFTDTPMVAAVKDALQPLLASQGELLTPDTVAGV